jgi:peptidoglycan/xylan/chitin deacetylase (PgdA/CDA1 family)
LKLPILVFHKIAPVPPDSQFPRNYVRPEQFDALLGWLRSAGYVSIRFEQYVAHRHGEATLPPKPIILTFDDGYRSNAEIALPIMKKHGFRATIFVVPGHLGQTNRWDAEEKQEPLLSAEEIRELHADGFAFGSHTMHHSRLTAAPAALALEELRASREALEALLQEPVRTICYPWAQHNEAVRRLAQEAGYTCGVGIRRRLNRPSTDIMALHRIPVTYLDSTWRVRWDLLRLRFRSE